MKRSYNKKNINRVFYLFGFIVLMAGMLLSMANVPAQAAAPQSPSDGIAAAKKPTKAPAASNKSSSKKTTKVKLQQTAEPTSMYTAVPTEVTPPPDVTPIVTFAVDSTGVCQMGPGPVSADVNIVLPAGVEAVLQTAWRVAEPADLRTADVYSTQTVTNGQVVSVAGQWPGIRTTDTVVEVHLGAILLDMDGNPISAGTGIDFFWYPWFCPVTAPATEVPTEVSPTEVVPTEVLPTEVVPTEVQPTEVVPTEVLPTEVLPTEVMPTEVLPTEVMPTEVKTEVPTEVVTEVPTVVPTTPAGSPTLSISLPDTAVCQMTAGPLSTDVTVTLPAGMDTAVLEWAYKVAEPMDLRTDEVYNFVTVTNGQVVTMTGQWPGVRAQDQVVEIHLGAILLDPVTMNPISTGYGMDFYWYPWFCPFAGGGTAVPTEMTEVPTEVLPTEVLPTEMTEVPTEVLPTEVLPTEVMTEVPTEIMPTEVMTEVPTEVLPTEVMPTEVMTEVPTEVMTEVPTEVMTEVPTVVPTTPVGSPTLSISLPDTAVCQMVPGALSSDVTVTLPAGMDTAVLEWAYKVAEPMDLRTDEVYNFVTVTNGQVVTMTGQWPGVRAQDQVVEIHLGAILLDPVTMNPISTGYGMDFYWYPWFCPFAGEATQVPTEVVPTEVLPTEVLPTEVLPTEVVPTEVLPTEVLPTEVLPTEVMTEVPTEMPTEIPTEVPTTPTVNLPQDQAVCVMDAAAMQTMVTVVLPEGQQAILQTSWRVAEPEGKRTEDVYQEVLVKNGDVITITGQWPGVTAGDSVVSLHFGAILLDPDTRAPISAGDGVDYYWYDWVCPVQGGATVTAPQTTAPSVTSAPAPSVVDVINTFWARILSALGW